MKRLILLTIYSLLIFSCRIVWAQEPIVILHTNDTHSQIESYTNKSGAQVGGIYCRAAVVEEVRKQYDHVILADAGDFSQGSPYFNFFKGCTEIAMMNSLGYQVGCLGNHEFDNGSRSLANCLKKADFPIVCANYVFKDKKLAKFVKKYVVLEVNGKKIGFFGLLIDIKALTQPKNYAELTYINAIEVAETIVSKLKNDEHCDYIVCLSHLGFDAGTPENPDDQMLAEAVEGIDVIIGGHSHTELKEAVVVNGTYIVQTGTKGGYIGKLLLKP